MFKSKLRRFDLDVYRQSLQYAGVSFKNSSPGIFRVTSSPVLLSTTRMATS